jgi:hypothetical protein
MALMKRSPKMTANCAFAIVHSRGGIFRNRPIVTQHSQLRIRKPNLGQPRAQLFKRDIFTRFPDGQNVGRPLFNPA